MNQKLQLLIIGAGPYGLALGLYAQQHKIDYLIVGKIMGFWEHNMPTGMQLRTPVDWGNDHNLEKPILREDFMAIIRSSISQKKLRVDNQWVKSVDSIDGNFSVQMENDETIIAEQVIIATGYNSYQRIPEEFSKILPKGRYSHNSEHTNFQNFKGKRCIIIGGRQGAFE